MLKDIDRFIAEKSFIPRLSTYLERFKSKGENTWAFRCPVCGDSHKSKTKARGNIFRHENAFLVKCYNCGYSSSLSKFIKDWLGSGVYSEYQQECLLSSISGTKPTFMFTESTVEKDKSIKLTDFGCENLDSLEHSHEALRYCRKRKIPEKFYKELLYIDDFSKLNKIKFYKEYEYLPRDKRLIIPYYDNKNHLIGFQGRTLENHSIRYMTMKIYDVPMIYGLHRWNKDKITFVTEGPIDSLFLPNAIAVSGADFQKIESIIDKKRTIIILDNERRNVEITARYEKLIDAGFNLVIWDKRVKQKDINDLVLSGYNSKKLIALLRDSCYTGFKAKVKLNEWKI